MPVTREADLANICECISKFPFHIVNGRRRSKRPRPFSLALYAIPYQCYHGNGGGDSILIDAAASVINCWLCPSRGRERERVKSRRIAPKCYYNCVIIAIIIVRCGLFLGYLTCPSIDQRFQTSPEPAQLLKLRDVRSGARSGPRQKVAEIPPRRWEMDPNWHVV